MDFSVVYDISVHLMNRSFTIGNVTPNNYGYSDLLINVCDVALRDVPGGNGMIITMRCDIPNTVQRMEVNNDEDVFEMFRLHQENRLINLFVQLGDENPFSVVRLENNNSMLVERVDQRVVLTSRHDNARMLFECDYSDLRGGEKFKLVEGMLFSDKDAFIRVLKMYVNFWCFPLIEDTNETEKFTAHCGRLRCPWRVHARVMDDNVTFKICACSPHAKCGIYSGMEMSLSLMSKLLIDVLERDPVTELSLLRKVLNDYGVHPTEMQLFSARQKALEMIGMNHYDSYSKLPLYAQVVMSTNPGSIAKLDYYYPPSSTIPSIKRFFMGFDACKKGFLAGCDPFLVFVVTYLNGPYQGVLLSALSLDGDNEFFPLAFAFVEYECKDSWMFFFTMLTELLGGFSMDKPWTFMIDKQKGLTEAINTIVPHAIKRVCCKYIYKNFRESFPGVELENLFWQASRAYCDTEFTSVVSKIKSVNWRAFKWLERIPVELWARHSFPKDLKNDHITNGEADSFNKWVGNLWRKPMLALLDGLRAKIMTRLQEKYEKACGWSTNLVPTVVSKLNDLSESAQRCKMQLAKTFEFEVKDCDRLYNVNLTLKTCSCKIWDLTGIPCKHAMLSINHRGENSQSYCHLSFSKEKYMKAYDEIIHDILKPMSLYNIEVEPAEVLSPGFGKFFGLPWNDRREDVEVASSVSSEEEDDREKSRKHRSKRQVSNDGVQVDENSATATSSTKQPKSRTKGKNRNSLSDGGESMGAYSIQPDSSQSTTVAEQSEDGKKASIGDYAMW